MPPVDPVDVVLPAGGRIAGAFARDAGATIKALIRLGEASLLDRTLAALRASGRLGRVVVVGPEEVAGHLPAAAVDAVLPEGPTGPANVLRGLEWLQAGGGPPRRALVAATDLPFLTPAAVTHFLDGCPVEAELCVPVVERTAFEARFPQAYNQYLPLRDGQWTLGCLFLVCPAALARNQERLEAVFLARKSQLSMARLLGPGFLFRFLLRRLTVEGIRSRCEELLGCRAAVTSHAAPELAYDLDLHDHYRYALRVTAGPRPE